MTIWIIGFLVFIVVMLALDLGVFHREAHEVSMPEALAWTGFWVTLALLFNVFVYFIYKNQWLSFGSPLSGSEAALQFLTGYLIEESLSLDNIFVIAVVFAYFKIPLIYQHRVLFWGILGAVIMRGIMISVGVALINHLSWIVYVFGGLLLFTAVKLLIWRDEDLEPEKTFILRTARRFFPFTTELHGQKFFIRLNGKLVMTPLFLVLLMVESMDLIFAVDSIPAILAVTREGFLVFTSNIFAILGLRSLYFALAALIEKFRFMKMSLSFLLAFIGIKMLISHHYPIPIQVTLAMIVGILAVGVLASILVPKNGEEHFVSPIAKNIVGWATLGYKGMRRIFILIIGITVLILGAIMIVTPGPGVVVIIIGLAILATEFIWARVLLKKMKEKAKDLSNSASDFMSGKKK